jgi:hypothetical protein
MTSIITAGVNYFVTVAGEEGKRDGAELGVLEEISAGIRALQGSYV